MLAATGSHHTCIRRDSFRILNASQYCEERTLQRLGRIGGRISASLTGTAAVVFVTSWINFKCTVWLEPSSKTHIESIFLLSSTVPYNRFGIEHNTFRSQICIILDAHKYYVPCSWDGWEELISVTCSVCIDVDPFARFHLFALSFYF